MLAFSAAAIAGLALTGATIAPAAAQSKPTTFVVDFSRWSGPPLVKTKFGVYQTPLITREQLLGSLPLLSEIGVQDLRYEIGWGKSDVLAYDQIGGTAAQPTMDFAPLDALINGLAARHVRPLLALTYCPVPLQSRKEWAAWKDLPSDLAAWQRICQTYVSHFAAVIPRPAYEVWNEPDMPERGGKMFFTGRPAEYEKLYAHTARGVRAGDSGALVGGAAIAYDLRYFQPIVSQSSLPLDFASIHAYEDYAPQIAGLRGLLRDRPDLPIYLTEYASFKMFGPAAPVSRHPAAARFFRDVKGLLALTDVTKVFWAQWADDDMGLVTRAGRRKALFNAFQIYSRLPADRCAVTPPNGVNGVDALASADERRAGVVVWNETNEERAVSVRLSRLLFARGGTVRVYRIDKNHASWGDDPARERLAVEQQFAFGGSAATWSGTLTGEGVVYLEVEATANDNNRPPLAAPPPVGTLVRTHHWFADRNARGVYADFDPRTCTARLGMGDTDFATAQIGAVLDNPARRFRVQVKRTGPFARKNKNSLFGLRLDFPASDGSSAGYAKSVLLHNGLYDAAARDAALPWGKGGAVADVVRRQYEMNTGRPFVVDLDRLAPPGWNGRRVLLSFVLQNAGAGAQARVTLKRETGAKDET